MHPQVLDIANGVIPWLENFAHFAQNSTTLRGRMFAGLSTNAAAGKFRLFVSNGATAAGPELPLDLATNVPYTLLLRYNLDTATSAIWVNPAAETDPNATATDTATSVAISFFGFREDSGRFEPSLNGVARNAGGLQSITSVV